VLKKQSFANTLAKLLTMDKSINKDFNGIKVMNIIDFLLDE